MAKRTWLILDCNYLCYRSYHTMGNLEHGGTPTGVIFGFMKQVGELQQLFQTPRVIFVFDSRYSLRKKMFPAYKEKRHSTEMDEAERERFTQFHIQVGSLRTKYLPQVGFRNVFCKKGFEGDDVIAALVNAKAPDQHFIIVTADNDMLQCLRPGVECWNPGKQLMTTWKDFKELFGIHPKKYALVKAIAGCATDEVPGIKRVGEMTAMKYLRGELKEESQAYQNIEAGWEEIVKRNYKLVKLPLKRIAAPPLQKDQLTLQGWAEVAKLLGFRSLERKPPFLIRRHG